MRATVRQAAQCFRWRSVRGALVLCLCLALMMLQRLPVGVDPLPRAPRALPMPFPGRGRRPLSESNATACRNTVQGPALVADDRGLVCRLRDLAANGCCTEGSNVTQPYACVSCGPDDCCQVFEHCVACCSSPAREEQLRSLWDSARPKFQVLFDRASDQYDLCVMRCRTNSLSLQHENKYRNSRAKHCFGAHAPELIPTDLK